MRVRLTLRANQDVAAILRRSHSEFGREARARYAALFRAAFKDLGNDPSRPGVREDLELGQSVRFYHLRHSRLKASPSRRIGSPRHYIVFRIDIDEVVVLRVLHDAMDLPSRLADL
jgi:toxin ParE1/3/4